MSLHQILKYFLFICIVIPIVSIGVRVDEISNMRIIVAVYNFLFAVSFYLILIDVLVKKRGFFNKTNLILYVFFYSLFFLLLLNFTYYIDHGDFFEYVAMDSSYYGWMAYQMQNLSVIDSIQWFLNNTLDGTAEDLGGVLMPSLAYRIYTSTFTYNFFNLIAGVFIAINIYSLSKNFMSNKYAFITALTYSISSFSVYLYTTGLKETFFVLVVVAGFNYYYKYLKRKLYKDLLLTILFLITILFYRPAVLYMIIIAMTSSNFIFRTNAKNIIVVLIGFMIIAFAFNNQFSDVLERYYGSSNAIAERKSYENFEASTFNYFVGYLSAIIGPFPSFVPYLDKEAVNFYSTGLVFRLLMSGMFLYGSFLIIKNRVVHIAPVLMFVLAEMFALSLILESFELRLNMPHFPFIYILSFYFYDNYIISKNKLRVNTNILNYCLLASVIIIIFWNFR